MRAPLSRAAAQYRFQSGRMPWSVGVHTAASEPISVCMLGRGMPRWSSGACEDDRASATVFCRRSCAAAALLWRASRGGPAPPLFTVYDMPDGWLFARPRASAMPAGVMVEDRRNDGRRCSDGAAAAGVGAAGPGAAGVPSSASFVKSGRTSSHAA